ncbi:uncharacterized protein N7459_002108 [Penicillium hispanicum]|uniref:uncharacterized protein n=1 Tax=Penicillium hispanicum TaxID=1080232 RepID=UPI002540A611|nr:uncharacterized protein N7459_002108 [Penicillium hispanicum]KAJ5591739.1 hypothetical protein N7459_002108 [Penicillium hispanicum]
MAAVMTQIECASKSAQSPRPFLKLDSSVNQGKSAASQPLVHCATDVFDISPDVSLQLLCNNIEKLNAFAAETPPSTASYHSPSTSIGSETPTDEECSIKSVGLHCGEAEDGDMGKEEAFQLVMLSRKFLSKKVPPIPLRDYLQRLHRYCPSSTAVYLATSFYITRMTLVEKVLRVTPKNMHRLVLAGLSVATKALEDLSYPHSRVAKVGGVSEQELSKLEISFCFLANFELRVDAEVLMDEARLQFTRVANSSNDTGG